MTKLASPTSPASPYSPYKPHVALRRPTSPHVFARFISKTTVTFNFHERFGFHEPVPWQPRKTLSTKWRGPYSLIAAIMKISAHMVGLQERMRGPRYDVFGPWDH